MHIFIFSYSHKHLMTKVKSVISTGIDLRFHRTDCRDGKITKKREVSYNELSSLWGKLVEVAQSNSLGYHFAFQFMSAVSLPAKWKGRRKDWRE